MATEPRTVMAGDLGGDLGGDLDGDLGEAEENSVFCEERSCFKRQMIYGFPKWKSSPRRFLPSLNARNRRHLL